MLDAGKQRRDFPGLFLRRDGADIGGLLEVRDTVGVADDAKDDIGDIRDGNGQCRGHLGQEGTQRGHNALVSRAVLVLIVFHRVHDGDHHDEVEAVLAEVGKHIADGDAGKLDHAAGEQDAGDEHDEVADGGNGHEDAHLLFAVDLAGDHGIEDHEDGRDRHAEHLEEREIHALIAELDIDVGLADAGKHNAVAYLLDEEDQGNPEELVIACNGGDDLLEAQRRHRIILVAPPLRHSENREGQENRSEDGDDECYGAVGRHRIAPDGVVAGCEHGDKGGSQHAADAGKERGAARILVSGVGV